MTITHDLTTTAVHDSLDLAELVRLARHYAERPELWEDVLRIPAPGEDRWWVRLHGDSIVDVWLLSWLPGQSTDLHDHGDSSAAFSVARGALSEVRADLDGRRTVHARETGETTWISPGVIHDVHGAGDGPAVSVHAYSPPLSRMTYYASDRTGQLLPVRSIETHEPEEDPRG